MLKVNRVAHLIHALTFLLLLAGLGTNASEPAEPEILCGPNIFTVGDAWEMVQLQNGEAHRLIDSGDLIQLPQKLAAISSHLRFMQRGAIMIFGKRRTQLDNAVTAVQTLQSQVAAEALAKEPAPVAEHWAELDALLKFIAQLLPDEALLPSTSFAHLLPPIKPALHIQLEPISALTPGVPTKITFQLVRLDNLQPIDGEHLFLIHEAPLHALICDRTLTDYHHEHPMPTGKPGEWELTFTPKFNDQYMLWINSVPKHTGREEFDFNLISVPNPDLPPVQVETQTNLVALAHSMRGEIKWNSAEKLEVNRPISGTLHLTDSPGNPVSDLQIYMGAFAHIVGIADDLRTILHVHPDTAIAAANDHGGPDIHFTLRPTHQGFCRLFVQVMRDNEVITFPFGVKVD